MFLTQLITAIIGTLGISLIFRVRPRYLAVVSLIGGVCQAIYWLIIEYLKMDSFIAALAATVAVAAISEILARIARSPAIVFLLAGVIPIVPGSFLYRMMKEFIQEDVSRALYYGSEAVKISLGVAGGIVVVSVIVSIVIGVGDKIRKRLNRESDGEE